MPTYRSRIFRLLGLILGASAGFYVVLCGLVFFGQDHLLFHPTRSTPNPPAGIERPREIVLTTDDNERLHAWYWPAKGRPCVVHFHGNAGHRGGPMRWLRDYLAQGYGLFVVDYRGYGGSSGQMSATGAEADTRAVLAWLSAHHIDDRVYSGRSLGTGLAVYAATLEPPKALLLHAGYSSMADVAAARFPWLPARWLLRERFPSSDRIRGLNVPLWMVHGGRDRVIPLALGRRLFDASPAKLKRWLVLPDATHQDVVSSTPNYPARVTAFIQAVDGRRDAGARHLLTRVPKP